jgi:excisionase family DNA binding protein
MQANTNPSFPLNVRAVEILAIAPCVSVDEADMLTGIGRTTIYQEIKDGNLKIRKCRGRSVLLRAELDEWLNSLPLK